MDGLWPGFALYYCEDDGAFRGTTTICNPTSLDGEAIAFSHNFMANLFNVNKFSWYVSKIYAPIS